MLPSQFMVKPRVIGIAHRPEMVKSDTSLLLAQVMDNPALRDGAESLCVDGTVSGHQIAPDPVALTRERTLPNQARSRVTAILLDRHLRRAASQKRMALDPPEASSAHVPSTAVVLERVAGFAPATASTKPTLSDLASLLIRAAMTGRRTSILRPNTNALEGGLHCLNTATRA